MACLDIWYVIKTFVINYLIIEYFIEIDQKEVNNYISNHRCTCVDFVSGTLASTRSVDECAVVLSRYREAFTAIVNEILKKLQFRFNSSALEEMDDDKIGKFHEYTAKFLNMLWE